MAEASLPSFQPSPYTPLPCPARPGKAAALGLSCTITTSSQLANNVASPEQVLSTGASSGSQPLLPRKS
uniref:Uncharacterized protein n=1 Tax=Sphaerodactylus townsendi TaxID=933632 RepID=A0ACB8FDJ7_9SAUR